MMPLSIIAIAPCPWCSYEASSVTVHAAYDGLRSHGECRHGCEWPAQVIVTSSRAREKTVLRPGKDSEA